jgi:opine dehydrogenase
MFDFPRFPENIRGILKNKGIRAEGSLSGFAPIEYAGHDIKRTLEEAELVLVVGPAYSTGPFAETCGPYLTREQVVVVCPGSCGGSVEFKNAAGLGLPDQSIMVAETSTLPYAVRSIEPGRIRIFLKLRGGLFLAALPSRNTVRVLEKIEEIYPAMKAAKNVLQTSLQNGNPVIHPAITLLNVALIERTSGGFHFYADGVTPAVGRLIKAIDTERIAIGKKLGIDIISDPELGCMQGYMSDPSYENGYSNAPGFRYILAQNTLDHRYFNEDVGCGLVFLKTLAEQIGVGTPCISSVINIVSLVTGRDYLGQSKRSMASLGLSQYTADELVKLLT